MSKDLSTKEQKDTEPLEKDLAESTTPPYAWLCGVQDGINLFLDELAAFLMKNRDNNEFSLSEFQEEVRAITHEIKVSVEQRITDLYTRERFPDFEWSRENWQRIKQLG